MICPSFVLEIKLNAMLARCRILVYWRELIKKIKKNIWRKTVVIYNVFKKKLQQ
jgi:hypothetical protein